MVGGTRRTKKTADGHWVRASVMQAKAHNVVIRKGTHALVRSTLCMVMNKTNVGAQRKMGKRSRAWPYPECR